MRLEERHNGPPFLIGRLRFDGARSHIDDHLRRRLLPQSRDAVGHVLAHAARVEDDRPDDEPCPLIDLGAIDGVLPHANRRASSPENLGGELRRGLSEGLPHLTQASTAHGSMLSEMASDSFIERPAPSAEVAHARAEALFSDLLRDVADGALSTLTTLPHALVIVRRSMFGYRTRRSHNIDPLCSLRGAWGS